MRGRKIDSEFLSGFITECVNNNKITTDEILCEAKSQIASIDKKIVEAEKLKLHRCKLLDVVITFEKPDYSDKINESKILLFFKIQNPHICKFICDNMKDSTISIESLYNHGHSMHDIIFCIKQLIEYKVISKAGNYLLRGELFHEYLRFVLKDTL